MKLVLKTGKWNGKELDALIVPVQQKGKTPKGLPKVVDQLYSDAAKKKEFSGEKRQQLVCTAPLSAGNKLRTVFFAGTGAKGDLAIKEVSRLVAEIARNAQNMKYSQVGLFISKELTDQFEDKAPKLIEALAEHLLMAVYEFHPYLTKKKPMIKQFTLVLEDASLESKAKKSLADGQKIAQIVNDSRDLANHPSNEMYPKDLAQFAKDVAKTETSISVKVLGEKEMEKLGMGCILGVSRGSDQEAQFIIAEYWGADKKEAPYVFVGKGVTFDSGGISIKPGEGMQEMKFDMCGATAALGIIRCAAALKLKLNVVSLMPASENMPGGNATKPGDILKAMDGTTVEVLNTDAEGRLLLADGLSYAQQYKPKALIDLATLTGACVVALNDIAIGMFTSEDELSRQLTAASELSGDPVWRLPLPDDYIDHMKSKVADLSNLAPFRWAGHITAAAFLKHFAGTKYPWVHLDIAGTAWAMGGTKYLAPGATGSGIRVITQWLREQE